MYEIINKKIYITLKLYDKDIEQVYTHFFISLFGFLLSISYFSSPILLVCFIKIVTCSADLFQLLDWCGGWGGRRGQLHKPKSAMALL